MKSDDDGTAERDPPQGGEEPGLYRLSGCQQRGIEDVGIRLIQRVRRHGAEGGVKRSGAEDQFALWESGRGVSAEKEDDERHRDERCQRESAAFPPGAARGIQQIGKRRHRDRGDREGEIGSDGQAQTDRTPAQQARDGRGLGQTGICHQCDRAQQERIRQTVAASRNEIIEYEGVVNQANQNAPPQHRIVGNQAAQRAGGCDVNGRAEKRRGSHAQMGDSENSRGKPHQHGVEDVVVGCRIPVKRLIWRHECQVCVGFVDYDRLDGRANDRPDQRKNGRAEEQRGSGLNRRNLHAGAVDSASHIPR